MQVTYNINNWNWQEVIFTRHTCKPNLKPEGLKNKAQSTVKAMEIKTRKKKYRSIVSCLFKTSALNCVKGGYKFLCKTIHNFYFWFLITGITTRLEGLPVGLS